MNRGVGVYGWMDGGDGWMGHYLCLLLFKSEKGLDTPSWGIEKTGGSINYYLGTHLVFKNFFFFFFFFLKKNKKKKKKKLPHFTTKRKK